MKIGWPTNVNRIIIDSTTITAGEGTVVNEMETGVDDVSLKSSFIPDVVNVTMDFDFAEKDENGLSEYDRFMIWYKFVHKRGTVPFEFPTIAKYGKEELSEISTYRITTSPTQSKRGLAFRVTMTWKEDFKEIIKVKTQPPTIQGLFADNGYVLIDYSSMPSTIPTTDSYTFTIFSQGYQSTLNITKVEVDEDFAYFYFQKKESGEYTIRLVENGQVYESKFLVE